MIALDRQYVWHPFTQVKIAPEPIHIVSGKGTQLFDAQGKSYLDVNSSWWVNLHGHSHPYINSMITTQLEKLEHVIFTDFTHEPAVELARRLIQHLPSMGKVFYSDNGSTANEVALKIAIQYWHNQNPNTKKTKVIALRGGYHGDTFGAMSSSDSVFKTPFKKHLFETLLIDPPLEGLEERSLSQMEEYLQHGQVACFIFEPMIQGVAGMRTFSKAGLNGLLKLCQKYDVISIADEVMTGFGRIGPLFACQDLELQPDLITLSKGITGGYMPLGATLCKEHIFAGFWSDDRTKLLMHGHSYCANPIACTAALASLDLLEQQSCDANRKELEKAHRVFQARIEGHPFVKRCEAIGTIFVLEYPPKDGEGYYSTASDKIKTYFHQKGILTRPLGNVFYLNPPYCISAEELNYVYETIESTLETPLWEMNF